MRADCTNVLPPTSSVTLYSPSGIHWSSGFVLPRSAAAPSPGLGAAAPPAPRPPGPPRPPRPPPASTTPPRPPPPPTRVLHTTRLIPAAAGPLSRATSLPD